MSRLELIDFRNYANVSFKFHPGTTAVVGLMARARADLERLVAMRSVAEPVASSVECTRAAQEVVRLFAEAGVEGTRTVETSDGSLAVVGHTPAPAGAPTVLLYSHYDVQPPGDLAGWRTDPWTLTDRDGRWYGRGAADCKGNLVMHLTALRALTATGGPWPVGIRVVCEGSEEASSGGLERLVESDPGLFAADVVVVADSGNVELGVPTVTTSLRGTGSVVVTVRTMEGMVHSGAFGGPAPDALAALVHILATLRDDAGETTVKGLNASGRWDGAAYPEARFRADAGVLEGVGLLGRGEVADLLWARPVANVLAIDAPSVEGATASIPAQARALVNLRVPAGVDAREAQRLLVAHLEGQGDRHAGEDDCVLQGDQQQCFHVASFHVRRPRPEPVQRGNRRAEGAGHRHADYRARWLPSAAARADRPGGQHA